ncbi:metal ABC transporter ATP-binding protein [Sporosarcina ureilytica]|uniref:Manganese transporter n=1 Tax=Sporosarcina ureilytica TaxID=298596 RepID=A0A1D8JJU6_9BACL|nr:metal ABC transporter ATP-binding protein [Sporosarcina ureilytica]AOV08981.1 manganese transporter [Sporosarcina ureilytica]
MENSIEVKHLSTSYYGQEALQDINFSAETGKLIGIIGPNGAGKSTLMKSMLGLIPIDEGQISFAGMTLKQARNKIAYVPQRAAIDWDFPIIVLDAVLLGTYPNLGVFRRPKKADREWAYECLKKVGMEDYSKRQIGELSGGQQQRVFLARALAQKADFFFLDEPLVGIDVTSEELIMNILKSLRDEGKSIFVVHHDLAKVEEYFEDLVLLNKKLIKSGTVKNVLRPELMREAYKAQFSLLDSMGVFS